MYFEHTKATSSYLERNVGFQRPHPWFCGTPASLVLRNHFLTPIFSAQSKKTEIMWIKVINAGLIGTIQLYTYIAFAVPTHSLCPLTNSHTKGELGRSSLIFFSLLVDLILTSWQKTGSNTWHHRGNCKQTMLEIKHQSNHAYTQ